MSHLHYLAYGSNLLSARLAHRIPGVEARGVVALEGYRLAFHKDGADGSGKCDLVRCPDSVAWGAVYETPALGRKVLDRIEGEGYERQSLTVVLSCGRVECFCYFAREEWIKPELLPFDWYRALVLAGARQHGFPGDYLETIMQQAVQRDPDRVLARHYLDMADSPEESLD